MLLHMLRPRVPSGVGAGYGEGAPQGSGPDQGRVKTEGNTYLDSDFPNLSTIKSAQMVAAGAA